MSGALRWPIMHQFLSWKSVHPSAGGAPVSGKLLARWHAARGCSTGRANSEPAWCPHSCIRVSWLECGERLFACASTSLHRSFEPRAAPAHLPAGRTASSTQHAEALATVAGCSMRGVIARLRPSQKFPDPMPT